MGSVVRSFFAVVLVVSLGAILGGCNGPGSANNGATPISSAAAGVADGTALTISGSPAQSVVAGTAYSFRPTATDAAGAKLSFAIANKPVWAGFDVATGSLSGTPTGANVGSYAAIQITASDGVASTALGPFSISVTPAPSNPSLAISGSPAQSVAVGSAYNFRPTATDAAGATLTFAINNKPAWAVFDAATGALSGTPAAANAGVDAQILITVSDGTHSAALAAFSISVTPSATDSLTLSWMAPSLNSNGTTVTDLAGYHIYYGASATSMNTVLTIDGASDTSKVISGLKRGTWYFAVTAFNSEKIESKLSAVLPITI